MLTKPRDLNRRPPLGECVRFAPLLVAAVLLAGCGQPDGRMEPEGEPPETDIVAPVFRAPQAILQAGTGQTLGEPSVWTRESEIYVAFPGCLTEPPAGAILDVLPGPSTRPCRTGQVYRSADAGTTWTSLTPDGSLTDDAPAGNQDIDGAADRAGRLYVVDLAPNTAVTLFRSDDGESWQTMGPVPGSEEFSDRPWVTAFVNGSVLVNWLGGPGTLLQTSVATSTDAGTTWHVTTIGEDAWWIGPVVLGPEGTFAYPYVRKEASLGPAVGPLEPAQFTLRIVHSQDGGRTWAEAETGLRILTSQTGGHWLGTLLVPTLQLGPGNQVTLAWAQEEVDENLQQQGTSVQVAIGQLGTSLKATRLSSSYNAIFPWLVTDDQVAAVAYLAADEPVDADYGGVWRLELATIRTESADDAPTEVLFRTVVDADVHVGGICSRGGRCLPTASDRNLLDFFEMTAHPDLGLLLAYAADPLAEGKAIEIRFARQQSGWFPHQIV